MYDVEIYALVECRLVLSEQMKIPPWPFVLRGVVSRGVSVQISVKTDRIFCGLVIEKQMFSIPFFRVYFKTVFFVVSKIGSL